MLRGGIYPRLWRYAWIHSKWLLVSRGYRHWSFHEHKETIDFDPSIRLWSLHQFLTWEAGLQTTWPIWWRSWHRHPRGGHTGQVWSLTQFYSVDFTKSRIDRCKKSAFSTNAQSRFTSVVVVDGVLGPPRLARHTWWCPCISVIPEATHETETRELLGAKSFPLICPPGKSMIFLQKGNGIKLS